MVEYKALEFMDLLEVLQVVDSETVKSEKLKDIIERKYSEILEYINVTGLGGELNIKLKINQEERGSITILADVSKKLKKIKNEIDLVQADDGKIFLDNPNQQVLSDILSVGVKEE